MALPTCGLASNSRSIGMLDNPRIFWAGRVFARMLWLGPRFVEYAFPDNLSYGSSPSGLKLSVGVYSKTP